MLSLEHSARLFMPPFLTHCPPRGMQCSPMHHCSCSASLTFLTAPPYATGCTPPSHTVADTAPHHSFHHLRNPHKASRSSFSSPCASLIKLSLFITFANLIKLFRLSLSSASQSSLLIDLLFVPAYIARHSHMPSIVIQTPNNFLHRLHISCNAFRV